MVFKIYMASLKLLQLIKRMDMLHLFVNAFMLKCLSKKLAATFQPLAIIGRC